MLSSRDRIYPGDSESKYFRIGEHLEMKRIKKATKGTEKQQILPSLEVQI